MCLYELSENAVNQLKVIYTYKYIYIYLKYIARFVLPIVTLSLRVMRT